MEHTPRILLVQEVADELRLAPVSVYRLVSDRRKGIENSFPLPISTRGGKLRFLASDIEAYIRSQSEGALPANIPSARKSKAEAKRRQEATERALQRHGLIRKPNKKEEV